MEINKRFFTWVFAVSVLWDYILPKKFQCQYLNNESRMQQVLSQPSAQMLFSLALYSTKATKLRRDIVYTDNKNMRNSNATEQIERSCIPLQKLREKGVFKRACRLFERLHITWHITRCRPPIHRKWLQKFQELFQQYSDPPVVEAICVLGYAVPKYFILVKVTSRNFIIDKW